MRGAGGAVSVRSIGLLIALIRLYPVVLSLPALTPEMPPQSGWLAGAIGVGLAVPFALALASVTMSDPAKNLVAQSREVLGAWAPPILGVVLCLHWTITAATGLRGVSLAYQAAALPTTPALVLIAPLAALSASIARRGIGLICAITDLVSVIMIILVVFIIVLPYESFALINLKPMLPKGLGVLTVPALTSVSFYSLINLLWMIMPRVAQARPKDVRRAIIAAVAVSGTIGVASVVVTVGIYGPRAADISLPLFSVTKMISIGEFLERLETLPTGFWLFIAGIGVATLYWAASQALGEALGVAQSNVFVYPLAAISVALSLTMFPRAMAMASFMSFEGWGAFTLAMVIVITVIMAAARWMKRGSRERAAMAMSAMLIASILASGCWDRREIETLGFIAACALDTADARNRPEDAGLVQVTVQITKPWAAQMGERGASLEKGFYVATATGPTAFEAIRNLNEQTPRRPYWPHNRWILIGEDLARAGVDSVLDFFMRDGETRMLANIATVEGSRGYDLMWAQFELELLPSKGGAGMLRGATQLIGTSVKTTLNDFLNALADEGIDPVLPRVVIVANSDEPAATGDLLREKIVTTAEISGAGAFHDGRLVGWLARDETRGLNWVRGDIVSSVISVPSPGQVNLSDFRQYVALEIMKASSKTSVRAVRGGDGADEVRAKVSIDVVAAIGDSRVRVDISRDDKLLAHMEKELGNVIRKEVLAAVGQAQRLGADIFGFGRMLMASDYRAWERIGKRWDDMFRDLVVEVDVKGTIDRSGLKINRYKVDGAP